ncbi:hypothetical protein KM043_013171 [Ampulex compressa]|nr:hypothetical protein KM043_013171 [Ampulex compressa]
MPVRALVRGWRYVLVQPVPARLSRSSDRAYEKRGSPLRRVAKTGGSLERSARLLLRRPCPEAITPPAPKGASRDWQIPAELPGIWTRQSPGKCPGRSLFSGSIAQSVEGGLVKRGLTHDLAKVPEGVQRMEL